MSFDILSALDRPIAFQRVFVEVTGSITAALFLSQAVYWQKRASQDDGWWYKTQEEWQEETGLSRTELDTARKRCAGIVLHKRKGLPCQSFYRIDVDALQTRLQESCKLDCGKATGWIAGKLQSTNTETTAEISTETKSVAESVVKEQAEEIYTAYPRKIAKPDAIKAIAKAIRKHTFEFVLKQTKAYAFARVGQDAEFTPHPATWFNGERYNDDPSTWSKSPNANNSKSNERVSRNIGTLSENIPVGGYRHLVRVAETDAPA